MACRPDAQNRAAGAAPALRLRDSDAHVRRQAAWALGEIGDALALPELERVAREDTGVTPWGRRVADMAREAAEKIQGRINK